MRLALMRAAATQFAEQGFVASSTRSILDEVGVTAPVLYHHFGSKAGLYVAVAETATEVVLDAMRSAAATAEDLPGRVEAVIASLVQLRRDHPRAPNLFNAIEHDVGRHEELAGLRATVEQFPAFWRSLGDDGDLAPATALAVRAVVEGFIRIGRSVGSDAEYEELATALCAVVRHGLRPSGRTGPVRSPRARPTG